MFTSSISSLSSSLLSAMRLGTGWTAVRLCPPMPQTCVNIVPLPPPLCKGGNLTVLRVPCTVGRRECRPSDFSSEISITAVLVVALLNVVCGGWNMTTSVMMRSFACAADSP